MKTTVRVLALLFFGSSLALVAATPGAAATRTLTVTPDSDLVGGDVVELAGTGYTPNSTVYFCQAVVTGDPDPSDCGAPFDSVAANAAGEFSANYAVQRFMGTVDCAAPSANCVMGASDFFEAGGAIVVTPITFTPQPPVTFDISGTVTGGAGAALLPGADVWLYTPSDGYVGSFRTTTDASGTYDLTGLSAGVDYRIRFGSPSGSTLVSEWYDNQVRRRNARVITLSLNQPSVVADAQLDEGGSISGSVTGPGGAPVASVVVWAFSPSDRYVSLYKTTTAGNGTYEIDSVFVANGYRVAFRPPSGSGYAKEWFDDAPTAATATRFDVTAGGAVTGIDAQLGSPPAST